MPVEFTLAMLYRWHIVLDVCVPIALHPFTTAHLGHAVKLVFGDTIVRQ